jgi:hypothetical protein
MDLSIYENKVFSQNGEDGITEKLIELIYCGDNRNKYYVEFGVQDGMECNTRILRERYHWMGLQMDGGNENESINLRREFITKDNVVELFQIYEVPYNINVLCVDIDYNDFYCLNKILENYLCDILICEYNATHFPHEDKIIIYDETKYWDGTTNYFGASLLSLYKLGKKYNYTLVYCDANGVNCFFIRDDIIREKNINILNAGNINLIYRPGRYGNGPNGGHLSDPHNRQYIGFDEAIEICNRI